MHRLRVVFVIMVLCGSAVFPVQAQQAEDRSFTLIKGTFHIHYPNNSRSGPQPDGDTLKFLPDTRHLIENLPRNGRPPKFTQTGITTIRFEGIDTLETHFSSGGTTFHQHTALALAARDTLLNDMGFGEVTFHDGRFTVESVEHHPIPGHILSNGLDVHGRTIAFVFTGTHPNVDGSRLVVEPDMLDESLNAVLLRKGQAYPAFYLTLPAPLREHLKKMVTKARNDGTGLWVDATATTTQPATIGDINQFQNLVMWPKLFRRLATFFADGQTDLGNLDAWLREDPRDLMTDCCFPQWNLGICTT